MSKNLDETARLRSEKSGYERLQGIAEGASSAPDLASLSAASFPGRNECPGAHCSLIEQEELEDQEVRTERESDKSRREEKWQTCWCCRDQQRACIMAQASAQKLEHTGPTEKERVGLVPQKEQLANTPELPLPVGKGTEPSVQSRVKAKRVQVSESRILASEREIRARA